MSQFGKAWSTLLLITVTTARAEVVTSISTGVDPATQALLANGAPDPKYVIAPGGTGGQIGTVPFVRTTPIPSTWLPPSSVSNWLVLPGSGLENISIGEGTYFFVTSFDLDGFLSETAQLTGLRVAADNKLIGVNINGTDVYRQPIGFAEEFQSFRAFGNVGVGLFGPGINVVRFEVYNASGITPMGLRVEGTITATAVPEPSGLLLTSSVAMLFGLRMGQRRWRRASLIHANS